MSRGKCWSWLALAPPAGGSKYVILAPRSAGQGTESGAQPRLPAKQALRRVGIWPLPGLRPDETAASAASRKARPAPEARSLAGRHVRIMEPCETAQIGDVHSAGNLRHANPRGMIPGPWTQPPRTGRGGWGSRVARGASGWPHSAAGASALLAPFLRSSAAYAVRLSAVRRRFERRPLTCGPSSLPTSCRMTRSV